MTTPDSEELLKGKSQIKREMHDLQDLARTILSLSKSQRAKLPLDESLQIELSLADKIKNKHEAYKRHIQYLGKMLREEDLEAIHAQMDIFANKHQQETLQFNHLEQIRDELISGGNVEVESLLSKCPEMERQKLRQLVRQANKEVKAEKPAKSFKELFQYIKAHYPL